MTYNSSSPQPAASVHALADVLPLPLQHTLNSLTVNLDQELARYRQQKQGITPQPQPVFRPRSRPLSLIDVKGQPNPVVSPAAPVPGSPPPPPKNPKLNYSESLDAPFSEADGGALATQMGATPDGRETYLASSSALLDSLAADAHPADPAEAPLAKSWAILGTPLGMGGLLLLLVASAGLGYALVNPAAIQHLATQTPLGKFWGGEGGEISPTEAESLANNPPERPSTLQRPDLSQSEFTDLSLSSLSTLPRGGSRQLNDGPTAAASSTPTTLVGPTAAAAPTTAPTTAAAATPPVAAPQVATAPAPAQRPVSRPANPVATLPTPAATPTPTAPPAQPAPPAAIAGQTYYVVTEYTGDPSLAAARQVVGDAYLNNFPIGARIQLGAYNTAADAEADAAAFQNQGISATVYTP